MRLLMVGLSHHTAALEIREAVALDADAARAALADLRQRFPECEAAVLSTCNRLEWCIARPPHQPPSLDDIRHLVLATADRAGSRVDRQSILDALVVREHEQAPLHLFRVACGLESLVLGEQQIIGQVRKAYELGVEAGTVGPVLHQMFQDAIAAARQARQQTGIDSGRMSIGSAAVDFARQVFDRFDDKTILGVGAGAIAKAALRSLAGASPGRLWVVNRTPARAQAMLDELELTEIETGVRPMDDLDQLLVEADIVITSTAAEQPIITRERMKPLLRRRRYRPLFIVDIALPRDVEPAVRSMQNVYLYDIDDLQAEIEQTRDRRAAEVAQCEQLLQQASEATLRQIETRDVGHMIRQLREKLHAMGEAEVARTVPKLSNATPEDWHRLMEDHTRRLINKILHEPLTRLDQRNGRSPAMFYASALRRLFALDADDRAEAGHHASPHGPASSAKSSTPSTSKTPPPSSRSSPSPQQTTAPPPASDAQFESASQQPRSQQPGQQST